MPTHTTVFKLILIMRGKSPQGSMNSQLLGSNHCYLKRKNIRKSYISFMRAGCWKVTVLYCTFSAYTIMLASYYLSCYFQFNTFKFSYLDFCTEQDIANWHEFSVSFL